MRSEFVAFLVAPICCAASTAQAQTLAWPINNNPAADGLETLQHYGINLRGLVINEAAQNLSGGVRQGATNVGQAQLGADFDLERILGLNGASLHVTEYHDYGTSLSLHDLGNGVRVQEIYKNPYTIFHFGLFAYEQKLFDDRLDFEAGRTAASRYFGHIKYACSFMSGTNCGIPALLNSEAGFSLLPSATWGGRISYHFTPQFYAMVGAFEVNASVQPTDGFNWSVEKATGETVPIEFGYGTSAKTDPYSYDIKFGAYYSNGGHTDPFYNTAGRSKAAFGGAFASVQDRTGAYLLADKTVWRDTESGSNVTLIGGYTKPFDNTEIYTDQIFTGAVWSHPFAHRPDDSIGFIVNYFRISGDELGFLHDSRVAAGGTGSNNPNEFALELNYRYQLTPNLEVMPDLQYIINPDNSALPKTKFVPDDALVVGLKVEFSFGHSD